MIYRAVLQVAGGKGGNGSISFRREKYIPRGGPDGGGGGRGGYVYVRGVSSKEDLSSLRYVRRVEGEQGAHGAGRKRSGKAGNSIFIDVPLGTAVWERDEHGRERPLGEVLDEGELLLVATGGIGGRGNVHFVGSTNKVPYLAEEGIEGEECEITLEVRPLVDVAIISLPSAGKSMLLARLTNASPPVGDYPFTTQEPVKGIAAWQWQDITFAELPALYPSAHEGKGLGNTFLCYAMRARVLLLLLDGSSANVPADVGTLRGELAAYDEVLARKPFVVAVNKTDQPGVAERLPELRRTLARIGAARHFIAAQTGEGVEGLVSSLWGVLQETSAEPQRMAPAAPPVRVRYADAGPAVTKEGVVFVVSSPRIEKLVALPDFRRFQARLQLRRELDRLGIIAALEDAGVQSGDTVRIGKIEFQWE